MLRLCLLPALVLAGCGNLTVDTGNTSCSEGVVHVRVENSGREAIGASETRVTWLGGAEIDTSDPHDNDLNAGFALVETPSIPAGGSTDLEVGVPSDDCEDECVILIEVNAGDPPLLELDANDNTAEVACD